MKDLPLVPVSWGELIDKITILEIKVVRLPTQAAQANAAKELELLLAAAVPVLDRVQALAAQLKALNQELWEIEDRIREHERLRNFDQAFIELARAIYRRNDARGAIKRQINLALGSVLIEEKAYKPYT